MVYYFNIVGRGCFNDSATVRDLTGKYFNQTNMTLDTCYYLCDFHNFTVAALQNGSMCFCGNSYGRYPKVNNAKCNCRCSGNKKTQCGCFLTNRIFTLTRKNNAATPPCCK